LIRRPRQLTGRTWVELGWYLFVLINTAGILLFPQWATVPFHFIWIGLSLLYGWLIWDVRTTFTMLAAVIVVTGFAMLTDVLHGDQAYDELTEIPLMAVVFVVMVWYVRRDVAANKELARVSEHNIALLQQERQFIQDASHVLRTPLTIALGHAELMRRAAADPVAAHDTQIIIEELNRLKIVSDRLLTLAATEQPDFVHPVATPIRDLVTHAWSRWSSTCPAVELGQVTDAYAPLDPARVLEALDELIGNAVQHTPPGTPIELSAQCRDGWLVVAVADAGPGIPPGEQDRVLDRFARIDKRSSGLGLGLAIVKTVTEAHGGHVTVRSEPGHGAAFELWFPLQADKRASDGGIPALRIPAEVHPGLPARFTPPVDEEW
jgi:signal transduction histidine kinase